MPAVADFDQDRTEYLQADFLDPVERERLLDHRVGGVLIESDQREQQLAREYLGVARTIVPHRHSLDEGLVAERAQLLDRLADRHAARGSLAQPADRHDI